MEMPPFCPRLGDTEDLRDYKATDAEHKELRRKIRNRNKQRAYRKRLENKGTTGQEARPYHVERWRLDEVGHNSSAKTTSSSQPESDENSALRLPAYTIPGEDGRTPAAPTSTVGRLRSTSNGAMSRWSTTAAPMVPFPLSADHLMHIMQFNVLLGLKANKTAVGHWGRCCDGPTPLPSKRGVPDALMPTPLQLGRGHSSWIDMVPFRQLRDNLIHWEAYFDHGEFLRDLVGEIGEVVPSEDAQHWSKIPKPKTVSRFQHQIPDGHQGLVLWGEPHDINNWELTPEFLAKWMWAAKGCEAQLIEISNRWRLFRGNGAMRFSVVTE
ncbi:hypothetical protein VD0002_g9834 [Verticillium dahliae]|nr:Lactose permease [Verticillium dahliae VDG2]PNH31998.1 hypothetical protein BJF96_g4882 [Verticillium dahliae]PNH53352.1 hypothetical protein VD0003_g4033 [Verticillium dahliae]PNH56132.1 hypothetical protein VD0002_g9834 [Verticillium dahliae]